MDEEKEKECVDEKIKKMVDSKIEEFIATGINANNLDGLYKLVDIKKDYEKIEYMKKEMEEIENEIQRI
jgi:hypothetical protein